MTREQAAPPAGQQDQKGEGAEAQEHRRFQGRSTVKPADSSARTTYISGVFKNFQMIPRKRPDRSM